MADDRTGRVDSWIWSVRLAKTRSAASGACRAGHVRVNGMRVKPAHSVRAGDEVIRHCQLTASGTRVRAGQAGMLAPTARPGK